MVQKLGLGEAAFSISRGFVPMNLLLVLHVTPERVVGLVFNAYQYVVILAEVDLDLARVLGIRSAQLLRVLIKVLIKKSQVYAVIVTTPTGGRLQELLRYYLPHRGEMVVGDASVSVDVPLLKDTAKLLLHLYYVTLAVPILHLLKD